jgi:peptidoglycan hydrolase-like protein with peptidoglycan-binding domain
VQRDLACEELWAQSLARSRARREAAAAAAGVKLPARSLSVAALVAVTGATAAGVTALQASSADQAVAAVVKSRGSDVRELQRKLGVPADGVFGPVTERALKRWQRAHGLVADGIAGPNTRAAMGLGAGPVLKRRSGAKRSAQRSRGHSRRGGGVRALQRRIGVTADGVFGPATEAALKRWQRAHGLVADGIAGPNTRAELGLGPGPVLRRGGSRAGGGSESSTLKAVIQAANRIASHPYKYGGGHGSFHDSGYDCSGSVSYALHGGGLLRSPLDSGDFMRYGAPGRGRYITIYANPGHVYMVVNGRRYDTSARFETGGSRWTNTMRSSEGYVVRHPRGL